MSPYIPGPWETKAVPGRTTRPCVEYLYQIRNTGGGEAVRISAQTPFHFGVHHSSTEDYLAASHDHLLVRRPETFVHIDAVHGPIGGDMTWSTVMPSRYSLGGGTYRHRFRIELL